MQIGLEAIASAPDKIKKWGKCAILCNQASVTKDLQHVIPLLRKFLGNKLVSILSPQHGLIATVQDNMIETAHGVDPLTGLPIFSLYSETRKPTEAMLQGVDTILVDLQIVGCRVYTFKASIRACLEAARDLGKKVVVLDRPNPVGGGVLEGPCINNEHRSFVGPDVMPLRHGLTVAELSRFFNQEIACDLDWVNMKNWDAERGWPVDRPWVLTSPNLPTLDAVAVYPGMVLLEGTNLSEGRGTGLPFQLIGAPFIADATSFVTQIYNNFPSALSGLSLRPTSFMPTSGKWANQVCHGFQIHVSDQRTLNSVALCLAVIHCSLPFEGFDWRQPPYEYEFEKLPMAMLLGASDFEKHIRNYEVDDPYWKTGWEQFIERSSSCRLYGLP